MTIRLSDYSDAELGALVRRSLSQEVIDRLLVERPAAIAQQRQEAEQARERRLAERRERKDVPPLPALRLFEIQVPALSMSEEDWNQEAPLAVEGPYRKIAAELGSPIESEEPLTWAQVRDLHLTLMTTIPEPRDQEKARALATVAHLTRAEAIKRVLALHTTTTTEG